MALLLGVGGCQTFRATLPDGTTVERAALGVRLEVGEIDVHGPTMSAHIKGLSSDAAEGMRAAAEVAKAAGEIAKKLPGGVP